MKRSRWFLLLVLVPGVTLARPVESCPVLPPECGLEWTYREGPDFDVCYAAPPGVEVAVFGIYLGRHPSFRPKRSGSIGQGEVGGRRVDWYRLEENEEVLPFGRQTLVVLRENEQYIAHVWVNAKSQEELESTLGVLKALSFQE